VDLLLQFIVLIDGLVVVAVACGDGV